MNLTPPNLLTAGILALFMCVPMVTAAADGESSMCTYTTYEWSVKTKGPVNRRTVRKPYAEVTDEERDPADPRCTVCSEDQETIDMAALGFNGVKSIKVCRYHRAPLEKAFAEIAASGQFEVTDAVGYRVGKTRGKLVNGVRTAFSNHSFGTAIDINAAHNGLYSKCNIEKTTVNNLASCKLGIGGHWNPKRHPRRTITRTGVVYKSITTHTGWKWGGEIAGRIRDLMHFSITGY